MAYCVEADVSKAITEAKVIQLTNDAGGATVDSDNLDAAIEKADAIIDTIIGSAVTVPLETVPNNIKHFSVDLTCHYLYIRKTSTISEERQREYELTLALLREARDGLVDLGSGEDGISEKEQSTSNMTEDDKQISLSGSNPLTGYLDITIV
jgi:phage gp36-like protein